MTATPALTASEWGQADAAVRTSGEVGAHLAGRLAAVEREVDGLSQAAGRVTTVDRGDVEGVERLIRRLEAVKLSMIAVAERSRVAMRTGSANTAAWVSQATRSGSGVAAGQVALATALDNGLDATKAALAEGSVSARHAAIIVDTMSSLPESLASAERDRVESSLVRQARQLEPGRLRHAATMALAAAEKSAAEVAAHQERVLQDQERRAYAAARFTMHHRGDGTTTGSFLVPTGSAQVLQKVLRSMTAPRRDSQGGDDTRGVRGGDTNHRDQGDSSAHGGQGDSSAHGGQGDSSAHRDQGDSSAHRDQGDATGAQGRLVRGADWDSLNWAEKQGRAFIDLLDHLPTERLTGKVASTIVVTMTADQVFGAARVARMVGAAGQSGSSSEDPAPTREVAPDVGAARCDTGHLHSTGEARRLACNAGILPLVLGGPSMPVDLGREQRLFSYHQRTVLATLYDECAAIGCDRPYAWSELHHLTPWRVGGRTDLKDAIPLCGHHHRRMHDGAFRSHVTVDDHGVKSVAFIRRI